MKRKLFAFLIVFFSISSFSFSIEPDIFVQSTVNRASKLLGENISKGEKIEKLKLIAKETVDIKGVAYYSLGSARKNLNENQIIIPIQINGKRRGEIKVSKSLESIPKSTAYLLKIPICFALGLLLAVPFSIFLASIATA